AFKVPAPGLTVMAPDLNEEAERVMVQKGWLDAMMVSPVHAEELREMHEAGPEHVEHHLHAHHTGHMVASILSILGMLAGAGIAWLLYGAKSVNVDDLVAKNSLLGMLWELASQLWYFDRLYQDGIVPFSKMINKALYVFDFAVIDQILVDGWAYFILAISQVGKSMDNWVVDKCVDLFGIVTGLLGQLSRSLQAGKIQYYVCVTFGAVALLLLALLMMQ
ncbi:MAG: hypothetical protein KIS92_25565, partial [Planctomycetota bacterium]|nr:hypothetical protein [Planctomycetota bacterium]